MSRRRAAAEHAPVAVLALVVAVAALLTHRNGIGWGDDYTLYLRQAKSLYGGNIGQVIADNRFNVDNAAKPGFSPYVYPWGWPLLLAPFVRAFGLDYGRLKWAEVLCWAGFVVVFHAVARRRMPRWVALATVTAAGLSVPYLVHTDSLLSEFPYMLAVAVTLWWLDRCRRGGPTTVSWARSTTSRHANRAQPRTLGGGLLTATRNDLIVLGLLAVFVFNVRREGLAMILAIAAVHGVELVRARRSQTPVGRRAIATPYLAFAAGTVGFQLLLPSAVAPSYDGAGLAQTWKKLGGPFRTAFGDQLGLHGLDGVALVAVAALVVVGVIVRLRKHAADDIALVVFAVVSMVIVGMIPANADRYLLAITPFGLYFAAQALAAIPVPKVPAGFIAVAVLAVLTVAHLNDARHVIADARSFNRTGTVVDGPESAYAVAGFDAVRRYTRQDDVVGFFKARSMTFFTDRRAIQSSDLRVMVERADYLLMRRGSTFSQPLVDDARGAELGFEKVWSDDHWVLWHLTRHTLNEP